jgi:hypothetical protein
MAFAFLQEFAPTGDRSTANYDAINDRIPGPPEGLIVHTAGFGEDGTFRIYDVWESKEHFQRFVESKLGPAMEASGGEAAGGQLEPQFFPVEVLVKGPAL